LDLKQIKQIIDLMKRSDLTEFAIEEQGFKLKICRGPDGMPAVSGGQMLLHTPPHMVVGAPHPAAAPAATPGAPPATALDLAAATAAPDEPGVSYIKSPMVGTFYRSASPESPAFVEIGAKIEEKTVICIIEAMKIMNEIQAETKGSILEVLVENGQPVEYGQRLYKIKVS
jgi:acetyl-CoA carboxylase biotin carboxyl carrier protein